MIYMDELRGIVWGRPLTWGTATGLHTAFTVKSGDDQVLVKCDFLCYVRWGDDVVATGSLKEREGRISDYRIRGRYFQADMIEDSVLGVVFERP